MAGNGVVLKPASLTPLIGERIGRALERAGVPEGLVRVIHGPGTGPALVQSRRREGLLHRLGAGGTQCRRGVRASAQGLGPRARRQGPDDRARGCQPRPRDRRRAVGRVCERGSDRSGIERVYVLDEVAERFVDGVIRGAQQLRVGDPMRWDTEIGPMINSAQFERVGELVDDAVAAGGGPALRRSARPRSRGPGRPLLCSHRAERRDARDADHAARRPSDECSRSSWCSPRTRRCGSRTTASSASGHRCGRRIAARGSGWPASSSPGWSGSTMTCSATAPASARGAASRTQAWAHPLEVRPLRVRQYQAAGVGAVGGAGSLVAPLRCNPGPCAQAERVLYGRPSIRAAALRDGAVPLLKVGARLAREALRR